MLLKFLVKLSSSVDPVTREHLCEGPSRAEMQRSKQAIGLDPCADALSSRN